MINNQLYHNLPIQWDNLCENYDHKEIHKMHVKLKGDCNEYNVNHSL